MSPRDAGGSSRSTRKGGAKSSRARGSRGASTNGRGADRRAKAPARVSARDAVGRLPDGDLEEVYRFWGGPDAEAPPSKPAEVRDRVLAWMGDPQVVDERVRGLGRRLNQILGLHFRSPGFHVSHHELATDRELNYLSPYDLEAGLTMLSRRGLVVETVDRRFKSFGGRAWTVPHDLAETFLRSRRERKRGVFHSLTLRGWLERSYDKPGRRRATPTRLRETYKMYSSPTAAVARVERLPEDVRGLVEKAVLQFGGILPRSLYERMDTGDVAWDGKHWGEVLRENLVGTVERVELARYGIQHADETLVVFNEVALAWLKRVAVPGDPDRPHVEASLGVDLVSNVSRFMGFIVEHNVRFTVRGEIFKTTEKRILQELIPNPGRELTRSEVLSFIYGFARTSRLIESTGERTFALTAAAREWEQVDLDGKLRRLLDHAVAESDGNGDPFHQTRMRNLFLRMLKRVEPETWYDLMYLPFLARNTYLSSLDELGIDQSFAQRSQGGHYAPMEDPQRLAWNLAKWVRQRVYLLGIVDLGYDAGDRPVALRLTRIGARMLGLPDLDPTPTGGLGSLIVTPDFEVVLFPNGDDADLVHELDRFCTREKAGPPMHFRISDRSVQRGLSEGVFYSRMVATLTGHSRTPVPQNVLYSMRDWAHRAGLILLDAKGMVTCEDPELLKRFRQDPAVRGHVREAVDEKRVQLKGRYSVKRMQTLLRELGFLVELAE